LKEDKATDRLQQELTRLQQRVAELEQADEALQKSEERYRALVENLSEVVYATDEAGVITYVSPAIEPLLGYRPTEVIGHHFEEFVYQDDLACVKENFEPILSGQTAANEYRVLTKSGEICWVRTSSQPTLEGTRVIGVHGALTNITERKQAEEEIQQHAAQLEALRQVALELTAELDLDALLQSIVSQAIELVGGDCGGLYLYRPERDVLEWSMAVGTHMAPIGTILKRGEGLSGKVWETGELLIVDDYQSWKERATIYEGYPFKAVVGVPVLWGKRFLGVLNVLSDSPGTFSAAHAKLLSLFATQAAIAIENASMYKQTRELATFNESVIKNVMVGISIEDTDGNFTFLNPAAAELFGYTINELIGKHWTTVVPPDQHAIVHRALKQRMQGKGSFYELEILRKDGTRRSILVSGSPRFDKGYYVGVQAVFTDITEQRQIGQALAESEERYRTTTDALDDYVHVVDSDLRIVLFNERFRMKASELGIKEDPTGKNMLELFSFLPPKVQKEYQRVFKTGEPLVTEEVLRIEQKETWSETRKIPILDEKGEVSRVVTIIHDITERKQAEEDVRQLSQFQESIIDNANVWLNVLDKEGNVLVWNKAAEAISGYRRDEVVGHDRIWECLYPDESYRKKVLGTAKAVIEGKESYTDDETSIRTKDGQTRIISWNERTLLNKKGEPIGSIALGRDVSERKQIEERLAYMATHDPLTDLPNRQAFNDRLGLELSHAHRNGQRLAVMMLDLDHFKSVNDTLGHSMGDQLLKAVGNRLTSLQRKSDTIARLGGDEFMLILPEIAETDVAEKIAEKLLDAVREQYVIDGHELHITTSIGVVIYPEDAEDVETLVKNADIAMYRAKDDGRNTYRRYTPRDR